MTEEEAERHLRDLFQKIDRGDHYILDDEHQVVPVDLYTWAMWFGANDDKRRVALTETEHLRISTVFLGLDHNWSFKGPPILFETMVFVREPIDDEAVADIEQRRYSSWDDAVAGHNAAVKRCLKLDEDAVKAIKKQGQKT